MLGFRLPIFSIWHALIKKVKKWIWKHFNFLETRRRCSLVTMKTILLLLSTLQNTMQSKYQIKIWISRNHKKQIISNNPVLKSKERSIQLIFVKGSLSKNAKKKNWLMNTCGLISYSYIFQYLGNASVLGLPLWCSVHRVSVVKQTPGWKLFVRYALQSIGDFV